MAAKGFAISISATDEVTQQVEKIKKSLSGLGKTAKQVSDKSGPIHRISVQARAVSVVARELGERGTKAFQNLGRAAEGFGSKIGSFAPALTSLTSAVTLAGFGELTRQASAFGVNMVKTSAALGMSATEVQRWQRAWGQAGLSIEQTTGMVGALNQAMLYGPAGQGPAAGFIKQFHIDTSGSQLQTLKSIADVVKRLHDEGQPPAVGQQILNAFDIPMDAMAQLEKGATALEKLFRAQREGLNQADVDRLNDLGKAYRGVADAASDFGSKMVADMATPLTAAATAAKKWLDETRGMPGRMQAIEAAVEALGGVLTAGLIGRLVSLFGLRGIAGPGMALAGVGAAGFGSAAAVKSITGHDPSVLSDVLPFLTGPVGPVFGVGRLLHRFLGGWGKSTDATPPGSIASSVGRLATAGNPPAGNSEAMIRAAIAAAGGNEMAQAGLLSNFHAESIGLNPGAVNPNSGATGWAQWIGPRKARLIALAQEMNLPPSDPRVQAAMITKELTGDYKGVVGQLNSAPNPQAAADIALRYYEGVNPSNSLTAGAPWDVMLSTHAARAQQYFQPDPLQATPGAAESKHEVTVHIAGAPPGTRTQVTSASGPSRLNLRTSYSMNDQ